MRSQYFKYLEVIIDLSYLLVMIYWWISNGGEQVIMTIIKENYISRWVVLRLKQYKKSLLEWL